MGSNGNGLTDKQKKFIDAYLISLNATKAARVAGYGGNDNTLGVIGHNNLRKVKIRKEIDRQLDEFAMGTQEILARLACQARGDIGDFATIQDSKGLASHPQSYIVKKFKKRKYIPKDDDPYEEIELELYDAHAPLVDLGKVHSLFADKVELTGSIESKLVILPKQDDSK